jgi:hypothetical protein
MTGEERFQDALLMASGKDPDHRDPYDVCLYRSGLEWARDELNRLRADNERLTRLYYGQELAELYEALSRIKELEELAAMLLAELVDKVDGKTWLEYHRMAVKEED